MIPVISALLVATHQAYGRAARHDALSAQRRHGPVSDSLILDESLASEVGIVLADTDVRRVKGSDETGHRYTRYFTRLAGAIRLTEAPTVAQPHPEVMFQRIIHEGLVGDAFLRRFTVTFDVPHKRVIFGVAARTI